MCCNPRWCRGEYKLFVKWTPQGDISGRELFRVHENPTEKGNDQAAKNKAKAEELEKQLFDYLSSVNAEKPKPKGNKRKKTPKTPRKKQST